MADTDTTDRRRADEDLAAGATVTIAQFRAVLQGFPETRPWGSSTPDVEVHAMTSPIKLSQNAQRDLRGLFGRRAMPKILAALDQLATTPSTGVTTWCHLGVGGYQVLYRRLPTGPAHHTPTYLVAGVTRRPAYPPPAARPAPLTRPGPHRRHPAMTTTTATIDTARSAQPHADRVVFLHAHPDDEAIFTGGTIALLAAAGCSVTLVVATSGQLGRRPSSPQDDIVALREAETRHACALLGVERVEFLRYRDSGMPGDPANHHPDAFAQTETDQAARRVAAIAAEEHAGTIVTYDAGGIYGHPDHIQVHRVGRRATQLAGIPTVYESTVDRDYLHLAQVAHLVVDARKTLPPELRFGAPAALVSTHIAVGAHLPAKRAAIAAHRSQVLTTSAVVTMPPDVFAHVYGLEWYIRRGPAGRLDDLTEPAGHTRTQPQPATAAA